MSSAQISFTDFSDQNSKHNTFIVEVANGARFIALDLTKEEMLNASNVVYLHVHRKTKRCYIGITVMRSRERWTKGVGYRFNRRFGNAIKKYGWDAFDSYILAFCDSRKQLDEAEIEAIAAAGGHKSKFTFNLSPGGDLVAENDKPIVGVNLKTGESFRFKSGAEAARDIGLKSPDMPMAVARGERISVSNWWFRFEEDLRSKPPEIWGEELRVSTVVEQKSKPLIAVNIATSENRKFPSTAEAARKLGIRQQDVAAVAAGKQLSAAGWWFQYKSDSREMPEAFGTDATRIKRDIPVYAHNLKTKEVKRYRNGTVAAQELNLYGTAVSGVIRGKRTSAKGWWFSYEKNALPPSEYKGALVAKARSKAIYVENLMTGEVVKYDSAKSAGESLGIHRSQISLAIKSNRSLRNYKFRFAD